MDISLSSIADMLLDEVWFELTFLLVVSLFASFIFARFGQPKVLAYIVVGVIIGFAFREVGLITLGDSGEEETLPEVVMLLAQLGSIVLLFMIGLECDLKEIYTKRSILIATGGVLIPWLAGYLIADLFGFGTDAIFIGATLVATSVAVTASVISEIGMIGTPVAYAIVGAAVVDDILGMVVLAVSRGLSEGNLDAIGLGLLLVAALVFVVLGAWLGSHFLTKLVFMVQISGYKRKLPQSGFVLALAIAMLYSFIAEVIQISAIVGAFVAGTVFAGSALRDGIMKGMQYLEALFVPLFFVSLGIAVNLDGIADAFVFGLVLTAVAVATKIVGCGLPARATGMSWWDSMAIGVGMTPRLEIALVIAYVGLSNGIIDSEVYSVVVFMGLLTALLAPAMLKKSLQRGGHALLSP
jgi:Kef-type K+ transport system membrane component KefB